MSSEVEVFFRFNSFSTCSLKELPNTSSPDLDDDKAPISTDPTVERPKLKLHSCAQCELPVISRFEHPEPTLSSSLTIIGEQELTYLPQHGPVCGAASVAGTILSLAAFHGLDMIQARETITVRAVQDVYNVLGVPNIYTSSVAVGNLTLKKCIMAFKLEAFPSWQLTIQDFGAFLESNPERKVINEWEKLKKGMATGSRYIFHSRNHYNRIFGWREVWEKTRPQEAKPKLHQSSVHHDEKDEIPTEIVPSVQNIVTLVDENDPYSEENVSKMIEQMQSSRKRGGGEDRPLRPLSTSTTVNACLSEPLILRGKTTKTIEKKSSTTNIGVKTVASLTSSLLPSKETSTTQDGAYVSQRHILMAKKGQRPQHWVPWEAVCLNTQTHKINVIFEVKMIQRKGL